MANSKNRQKLYVMCFSDLIQKIFINEKIKFLDILKEEVYFWLRP